MEKQASEYAGFEKSELDKESFCSDYNNTLS
jgi:hypothetical protein